MKKIVLSLVLLVAMGIGANAGSKSKKVVAKTGPVTLFHSLDADGAPYRIPTITTTRSGRLIALADKRWCGADIGFGHIDVVARISDDNGATWGEPQVILDGNGIAGDNACGYGDAAMVADAESNTILVMAGTGNMSYWSSKRNNPLRQARIYSYDNGKTWTKPVDVTESIYSLFDARGEGREVQSLFCGSGRILQSKMIKAGTHYRVYTALCTHSGNFVLYSDNLGQDWNVLGGPNAECAPKGDEPKCEELPNGDVLLSSRCHYGRMMNIYHYSDANKAQGEWEQVVNSFEQPGGINVCRNATNGEVLMLPAKRNTDGKRISLLLQSIPAADNRSQVTIFYKPIVDASDYVTVKALASNWEGSYKVTDNTSAYSTMSLQRDGRIAFYLEENETSGGYDMNYYAYTLEELTNGKYSLGKTKSSKPKKIK